MSDDSDDPRRDEPFGELADELVRRSDARPAEDPLADAFEEESIEEIDDATARSTPNEDDGDTDGSEEAVVPIESYCQQCEHFSAPPRVECGHGGTEILELVDTEHFRVSGCPFVDDGPIPEKR